MKIPALKFEFGETVFHKVDPDNPGMITGVSIRPGGVTWCVTWSDDLEEKWHYEIELTTEKDYATN